MGVCVLQEDRKIEDVSDNASLVRKIFEEHRNFLRVIVSLHIDDQSDVDDFLQDLFLFLTLKTLPNNVISMKGYLNKIVSDRLIDFYRRRDRYKRRVEVHFDIAKSRLTDDCPRTLLVNKEDAKRAFKLIREDLPYRERQAVTLKFVHDFSAKEIAGKMGVNVRSASSYVSAGINKIRKMMT